MYYKVNCISTCYRVERRQSFSAFRGTIKLASSANNLGNDQSQRTELKDKLSMATSLPGNSDYNGKKEKEFADLIRENEKIKEQVKRLKNSIYLFNV